MYSADAPWPPPNCFATRLAQREKTRVKKTPFVTRISVSPTPDRYVSSWECNLNLFGIHTSTRRRNALFLRLCSLAPAAAQLLSLRVQIYSSTTEMFNSPTPLNDLIPSHVFLQQGDMHRSSSRDGQPLLRCSILMLLRIWQTGISSNKSINSSSARPPPRMFFHFKKSNGN